MAPGMRSWLALTLAGCAAVALATLPPDVPTPRRQLRPPTQETVRYRALQADAIRTRERLRRLRLTDTLSLLAAGSAGSGIAVAVLGDGVSEGARDRFRDAAAREAAALPERTSDVALGVFVVPGALGDHPAAEDLSVLGSPWPEFFLGERDGVTHCWAVKAVRGEPRDRDLTQGEWGPFGVEDGTNMLGPCYWVALLGAPGPATARWLRAGGQAFAQEPPGRRLVLPYRVFLRRRSLFGFNTMAFIGSRTTLVVDGCLAARPEWCARFFDLTFLTRRPQDPAASVGSLDQDHSTDWYLGRSTTFGFGLYDAQGLIADLHEDFGTDRLRAFWTADAEPAIAFRDAFGVDAGTWVAGWVRRTIGDVPPGPAPTGSAFLGALVVLALGAGAAVLVGRRSAVSR